MKKGDFIGTNKKTGEKMYFIAYSSMNYKGQPLLLCHTNPDAKPRLCGQYLKEHFEK